MSRADASLLQDATAQLKSLGIKLAVAPGEYIVNFTQGSAATEYRTDAPADGLASG